MRQSPQTENVESLVQPREVQAILIPNSQTVTKRIPSAKPNMVDEGINTVVCASAETQDLGNGEIFNSSKAIVSQSALEEHSQKEDAYEDQVDDYAQVQLDNIASENNGVITCPNC